MQPDAGTPARCFSGYAGCYGCSGIDFYMQHRPDSTDDVFAQNECRLRSKNGSDAVLDDCQPIERS